MVSFLKSIGLDLSLTAVSGSSFTKMDLVYEEREGFDFLFSAVS